jgi:predicted TIM-barrel fold metal-dependent hydrolase
MLPEDLLESSQIARLRAAKKIDIIFTGSIQRIASRIQCGLASIHVTNIYVRTSRNVDAGSDKLSGMAKLTRRELSLGLLGALQLRAAPPLVDTHVHLFADDQKAFPYHANASYRPPAEPLAPYLEFVRQAKIDHVVIVHPEPYQDDHRYLKYCIAHEPSKGFFKGTCLFDPISAETPVRMKQLTKELPGRIAALRIHATADPKKYPTTSGPIRDRDLGSPQMAKTWKAAQELGLAIQMHFIPFYAPQIRKLAEQFRGMPVILDHLGRVGQGTPAEYEEVLRLSELPKVYMKYSGEYTNRKQDVQRAFKAFGADRMIWGGLGMNMDQFRKNSALFDSTFDFTTEEVRAKIRGLNAMQLYRF